MMTFEEYCITKKIDPILFNSTENQKFNELKVMFEQVSEASFTQQKLFLINPIRRKYPYKAIVEEKAVSDEPTPKPKIPGFKPVIKPKM